MKHPKLVEITWADARSYYERVDWNSIATRCDLSIQKTVGYLHSQDENITRVAHTYDDNDEESPDGVDITVIPTGWIKSMRYLRKVKDEKQGGTPQG